MLEIRLKEQNRTPTLGQPWFSLRLKMIMIIIIIIQAQCGGSLGRLRQED